MKKKTQYRHRSAVTGRYVATLAPAIDCELRVHAYGIKRLA